MQHMFSTLPLYLQFLGTSIGLVVLGMILYIWATPHREFALIRQGNRAAATGFGGTLLGLAYAINAQSSSTWVLKELAAWGLVAVIVQILVFFIVSRLLGDFKAQIEKDNMAYGLVIAFVSIGTGVLNAGALAS
jgi:putative membrane protein